MRTESEIRQRIQALELSTPEKMNSENAALNLSQRAQIYALKWVLEEVDL